VVRLPRHGDDLATGIVLEDLAPGFEAAPIGLAHIDEDHVRVRPARDVDRVDPSDCLTDNGDAKSAERCSDRISEQPVVIQDEDPDQKITYRSCIGARRADGYPW
jgi:hypothetical protein